MDGWGDLVVLVEVYRYTTSMAFPVLSILYTFPFQVVLSRLHDAGGGGRLGHLHREVQ